MLKAIIRYFVMPRFAYKEFTADWVALGGALDDVVVRPVFDSLLTAHADSKRHFHDTRHVLALLKKVDQVEHLLEHRAAVRMAIWFHDVICIPGDAGNEAASADFWMMAAHSHLPESTVEKVVGFILDTRHNTPPTSHDGAVLADIDLAGLGANARVFAAHAELVAAEFPQSRLSQCVSAHRGFLESLLMREWIYHTDHFRDALENQARQNIGHFLSDQARAS